MVYALYVLVASLTVFFFGYRPLPIFSEVKDALLFKRHGGVRLDYEYSHQLVVTAYGKYRLWKRDVSKDGTRHEIQMPITGIELFCAAVFVGFIYLLAKTGFLVGLLYSSAIIAASIILVIIIYYLLDRFIAMPRLSKLIPKKSAAKKEELRVKKLAEAIAKKEQWEKERKSAEQKYNEWLSKNMNIAIAPAKVDLKKIPKPIGRGERMIQSFKVNYWTLKIKICRPFSR